ncbi:MAG: pilus assembly protein [Acidobacteriota bacterium]|nr:pilus assembly protein [Acidobacteriota bacterium]
MKRLLCRTKARDNAGQALVELALSVPLLLIILVGVAEFGRFAYFAIEISNAAHAGVQYGAQTNVTASDRAGMQSAATSDGSDVPGISASAIHYCACSNGTASTCLPTDCGGARIVEYVKVNTTATVSPMFSYPGISQTLTLTGQAVMRVEQ